MSEERNFSLPPLYTLKGSAGKRDKTWSRFTATKKLVIRPKCIIQLNAQIKKEI